MEWVSFCNDFGDFSAYFFKNFHIQAQKTIPSSGRGNIFHFCHKLIVGD